jgi:hypothetical protein
MTKQAEVETFLRSCPSYPEICLCEPLCGCGKRKHSLTDTQPHYHFHGFYAQPGADDESGCAVCHLSWDECTCGGPIAQPGAVAAGERILPGELPHVYQPEAIRPGKEQCAVEGCDDDHCYGVLPVTPPTSEGAQLTRENGSFIPEVYEQILIKANCGVAGHFRFQENGGHCMMCQRTAALESENKRLKQEEQHFLNQQEVVTRAIKKVWPQLQGQLERAIRADLAATTGEPAAGDLENFIRERLLANPKFYNFCDSDSHDLDCHCVNDTAAALLEGAPAAEG